MPINLKRHYCERIQEEVLVDIGRRGIMISCDYYHKCFNRYSLRLNFFCSRDFPENKTCLIVKLVAQEIMNLVRK